MSPENKKIYIFFYQLDSTKIERFESAARDVFDCENTQQFNSFTREVSIISKPIYLFVEPTNGLVSIG